MLARILAIYDPAVAIGRLPQEEVARKYPLYRWQMMATIFIGYASFYLLRNNFANAKKPMMEELGLTTGDMGLIGTMLALSYGVSKFVSGALSDRSNPRYFMATGLILSAVANLFMGLSSSLTLLAVFWLLNGWFQGMGWPPCGRVMTHWFSDGERGTKFAFWNIAHNVGGGIIGPIAAFALLASDSWRGVFFVPAAISLVVALGVLVFLRDTPQSVGLPPVEEYMDDYPPVSVADREKELTAREILLKIVLPNRYLWLLGFANVFVYVVRYGVLNWAPTYLTTVKGASRAMSGWQFFAYEFAGILGTLLAGWASDKFFRGRRGPVAVLYMVVVTAGVLVYWLTPPGSPWLDTAALLTIGCFVYGPVMLLGVAAVDAVTKKAAGTAAGFIGLFGYVGGVTIAELGIGRVVQHFSWDGGFIVLVGSCVLATLLLALTWNLHARKPA